VLKRIIEIRSGNTEMKRRLQHKWKVKVKVGLENWM
jgi:hypothetical protein